MSSLPRFLTATNSPQERKKCRDPKSGSDDRKRSCRGVSHIFIHVINIWTHGTDHVRKSSGFTEVGDDFSAFHSCIIILVDKQWLDDDQNLVHVGSNKLVELVEYPINDLNEQMSLLIF